MSIDTTMSPVGCPASLWAPTFWTTVIRIPTVWKWPSISLKAQYPVWTKTINVRTGVRPLRLSRSSPACWERPAASPPSRWPTCSGCSAFRKSASSLRLPS
ncbi:hypothetical protein RvY_11205-2 [Ramazzottius varieornatus]|uniref:Uncharacterized protein n=1 Tax=Ramazzottius varieornatus TaxID=947166 RepID=A0A1D1VP77_RAMVA|nr:hypothetical protein RvY_11205-2 [Ramazzottius varieornatus]